MKNEYCSNVVGFIKKSAEFSLYEKKVKAVNKTHKFHFQNVICTFAKLHNIMMHHSGVLKLRGRETASAAREFFFVLICFVLLCIYIMDVKWNMGRMR